MISSLLSIAVTLGLAYIWLTRGFFSALINLLCTIIAGAIAFALWEPLAYSLLDGSEATGAGSVLGSSAWAISLAGGFAVSLAVLRVICDQSLKSNVIINPKADYAGGAICGGISGLITVGILVISVGFMRHETTFGPEPVKYNATGNLVREGSGFFPADVITARLYSGLSERAFRTSEPLARWRPDFNEEGALLRTNFGDGAGRNTTKTTDFEVIARFTVGQGAKNFSSLLKDAWSESTQQVVDINGQQFPPDTYLEGFVVNFKAGAREKEGRVAVGSSQVWLILENAEGERLRVFPIAVASQADSASPTFARWRYDAKGTYIASVGGAADSIFAFEFPCPPGYEPIAMYVKSARHDVKASQNTATARLKFPGIRERDNAIRTGMGFAPALMANGTGPIPTPGGAPGAAPAAGSLDTGGVLKITRRINDSSQILEGLRISNTLPWTLQEGSHGGLELGDERVVMGGKASLGKDVVGKFVEKNIRIDRFAVSSDTVMVQVDVSPSSRISWLGKTIDAAQMVMPPTLIDTAGQRYQPIGYTYEDETKYEVSFNPGQPIRALSEVPAISRSRPAQKLSLLFRVSRGVEVRYFAVGSKVIAEYEPALKMDQAQK